MAGRRQYKTYIRGHKRVRITAQGCDRPYINSNLAPPCSKAIDAPVLASPLVRHPIDVPLEVYRALNFELKAKVGTVRLESDAAHPMRVISPAHFLKVGINIINASPREK